MGSVPGMLSLRSNLCTWTLGDKGRCKSQMSLCKHEDPHIAANYISTTLSPYGFSHYGARVSDGLWLYTCTGPQGCTKVCMPAVHW